MSVDVPQMHKHINRDGLFIDSAFTESALMGKTLHLDPTGTSGVDYHAKTDHHRAS